MDFAHQRTTKKTEFRLQLTRYTKMKMQANGCGFIKGTRACNIGRAVLIPPSLHHGLLAVSSTAPPGNIPAIFDGPDGNDTQIVCFRSIGKGVKDKISRDQSCPKRAALQARRPNP